jgi:Fe-S-cluster containining protein
MIDEIAKTLSANAARSGSFERFGRLARKLQVLADQEILKVQSLASPCDCKPGCNYCCRGLVSATLPELAAIVLEVESWPASRRKRLDLRIGEYMAQATRNWKGDLPAVEPECPFLNQGRCSIYELRPLHCRSKSSYSADACKRQLEAPEVEVQEVAGQSDVCIQFVEATLKGFLEAERPAGTYEMAPSLQYFLQGRPGLPQRFEVRPARQTDARLRSDLRDVRLRAINLFDAHEQGLADPAAEPLHRLFGLDLPMVYSSMDHAEASWTALNSHIERMLETKPEPDLAFHALVYARLFYLPYAAKDVKPLLERLMGHVYREFASKALPQFTAPLDRKRKPGPFRLGYLSTRLISYNGSRWALGWLASHGPEIETYALNACPKEDTVSLKWRRLANHYYRLPFAAAESAELVRSLDLDALVFTDVGEDGLTLQLSLLRLARWQFGGWGRVITSGSPQIDFYLSSADMEPEDGNSHYTERLVRLPGSGQFLFPEPIKLTAKSRDELGLPDRPFFFVGQNPSKLHPSRDALYRKLSERSGKLVVLCSHPTNPDAGEAVRSRMSHAGVDVHLLPRLSLPDYLRVAQLADTVLDSLDFSGGMTTVQLLTAGIPVVSCPGPYMRGRMAIPFLRQAEVEPLIAGTEEEFVDLACDSNRINEAAENLRPDGLFRDLRPVRALDEFLLSLPASPSS